MINWMKKTYHIIFTVLIGVLLGYLLCYSTVSIFYDNIDSVILFQPNNWITLVFPVLLLLVLLGIMWQFILNDKIEWCVGLLVISLVIKLFWVINFPLQYYFDMTTLMDYAKDIVTIPDTLPFTGYHYLRFYGYNLPATFLNVFYVFVFGENMALIGARIFNVFYLIGIDLCIWFIAKEISNRKIANFTLLISVLFFPFTGLSNVVYNDVNSTFLLLIAISFFVHFVKVNQWKYLAWAGVFLILGNFLRSIGVIFFLAAGLYLLLNRKVKLALQFGTALFVGLFTVQFLFQMTMIKTGVLVESEKSIAIPATHYVLVGLSTGVHSASPGYYYPYLAYYIGENGGYDRDEYSQWVAREIGNRVKELGVAGVLNHGLQKFFVQWGDGTFEMAIINNLISNKDDSPITFEYATPFHRWLLESEIAIKVLVKYCRIFWVAMIAVIFAGNFIRKRQKEEYLLKLIIMGFMGFYLLWETSPHYSFAALPFFVLLFGQSFSQIIELLKVKGGNYLDKSKI